eukprot:2268469-Pyramimonas_sp.AAC.1
MVHFVISRMLLLLPLRLPAPSPPSDGVPRLLSFCMLPHFPDHLNSSWHRFWTGWWGYAKRQQ